MQKRLRDVRSLCFVTLLPRYSKIITINTAAASFDRDSMTQRRWARAYSDMEVLLKHKKRMVDTPVNNA